MLWTSKKVFDVLVEFLAKVIRQRDLRQIVIRCFTRQNNGWITKVNIGTGVSGKSELIRNVNGAPVEFRCNQWTWVPLKAGAILTWKDTEDLGGQICHSP